MRLLGSAILITTANVIHDFGVSPWIIVIVVTASLILGLVRAVVPQDSADRLHLLLALLRPKKGLPVTDRQPREVRPQTKSSAMSNHAASEQTSDTNQLTDKRIYDPNVEQL
jgi:hypothetical protein